MSLVTVAVGLLLCWVAIEDLRHFRIRNGVILALGAAFVVDCIAGGRAALLFPHGVLAILGLILLSALFATRVIGGGDAKLLSAALFWVGPEGMFVFATILLFSALISVVASRFGLIPVRFEHGRKMIPFGPSIALAWIIYNGIGTLLRN